MKIHRSLWIAIVFSLLNAMISQPVAAKGAEFMTGFKEWRAGDFSNWTFTGVILAETGEIILDLETAETQSDPFGAGNYFGGNFYNGSNFQVGQAVSPEIPADFDFSEMIVSWNSVTPSGTWVEILARVQIDGQWTKWYNLGVWASDESTIMRHSVKQQGDGNGYVAVDTLVLSDKKSVSEAYQLKVRLFSDDGINAPVIQYLAAAVSTPAPKKPVVSSGNSAYWNTLLEVPKCSQMVYPDGGNVWCSPTSVSMVLGYLEGSTESCEQRVRAAVAGVYDWVYDGHGNWVFNTAYAATHGFIASVRRFTSLNDVEPLVANGNPVVFSFAWGKNDLAGAAIESSNGHLAVIVGFDSQGNPIVNDPAAASDGEVRRTYDRAELERIWLENSAGTVYVIQR